MITEAETKEIEKDIASIDVNRANFEHIAKTGKINGNLRVDLKRLVTRMAEKKNLEIEASNVSIKIWKNTAGEFKKYNDDLKAQLEAAQEEIEKLKTLHEINREKHTASQAELSRVKEVAKQL